MPKVVIIPAGDGCWPDLVEKRKNGEVLDAMGEAARISFAGLHGGMASGRASVSMRIDLPDGRAVLTETSLRLFKAAATAFAAKYPDDGRD